MKPIIKTCIVVLTNPSPEKSIGPRWTLGMRAIGNLIDFKTPFFSEKTPKAE